MLDLDGHLMKADELVSRVDRLIREGGSSEVPSGPDRDSAEMQALSRLLARYKSPRRGQSAPGRSGNRFLGRVFGRQPRHPAPATDTYSAIEGLAGQVRWLVSQVHLLHGGLDAARRHNVTMRMELSRIRETLTRWELEEQAERSELRSLQKEVATLIERLGAASSSGADIDYASFEDRFRGSSEEVMSAQRDYLRYFPPPSAAGEILDVGCGRGEMLEVLIEAGHRVVGVDMDPTMIEVCRSKGLPAVQDDVLHYLANAAPGSFKGIFCSQVVEHFLTSELERFVRLAHDRLRPSGVLLIETINPRSLYALGNHFFADTSHVRPVHPETLRFLCEQIGFKSVGLEELSEHPLAEQAKQLSGGELEDAVAALLRTVYGYQDYVIAATK